MLDNTVSSHRNRRTRYVSRRGAKRGEDGGGQAARGKDKWTNREGRIYGTKGKDLNGLSQKAFSYSPWQTTMAKWREREHILNRFPSSVHDVFMCRATGYQNRCVHTGLDGVLPPPFAALRGLASFFGAFEFKRFKAISQGVNAPDPWPSNADRPTRLSPPLCHPSFFLFLDF